MCIDKLINRLKLVWHSDHNTSFRQFELVLKHASSNCLQMGSICLLACAFKESSCSPAEQLNEALMLL